jgi:elongation factor Ts
VHHDGKKAALVSVTTEAADEVAQVGLKELCMHIVFANPSAATRGEIAADRIERERAIYLEEVKGKPKEMQDKIVAGKLDKFYADNVLPEQKWFMDDTTTVQKVVEAKFGKGAKLEAFVRYQIGK